jgi:hypothetical protein
MNIGKWPSVESVFNEWCLIAEAFPFLKLTCQLFNDEVINATDSRKAVVQYTVEGGKVILSEPRDILTPKDNLDKHLNNLWDLHRERGCSIEQLQEALTYVRAKIAQN